MRMKPIFAFLVALAMGVVGYTFALGWRYHHGHAALAAREAKGEMISEAETEGMGSVFRRHFVWGMLSGVTVCLVHSVVLTYFLGTGKAIKEQTELQNWDDEDYLRWKKLMARSVLPSSLGIALICVMAFSGGFTMIRKLPPDAHMAIAAAGYFLQIPLFMMQWRAIAENGRLMDKIVEKLGGENVRLAL